MDLKIILPALLLFCLQLNSQNAVVFSNSNITVNAGDDFVMSLKTQNFTDVSSFSFGLSWDETLIDFDTIITFNTDLPLNKDYFNMTPSVTGLGKLAISWYDISGVGKSLANNTTLFEIRFKALSNPGSTLLAFSDELTPIIAENLQGLLPVSIMPGTITVQVVNSTDETLPWANLSIYPNPAQEYVLLQYSLPNASPAIAEILDFNGKLIEQQKNAYTSFGEFNFETSMFPSGNYIVRLTSEDGTVSKGFSIMRK